MKKILLTFSIIMVSLISYSQDEVEIPKGTNKITMRTELNERDNVKLLLRILKDNDFEIGKLDTTIFQFQTSVRNLKRKSVSSSTYTLNFNLFDGYISVTGRMSTNLTISMGMISTEVGNNEISNKGMGGSPLKECFKEMNELCLKLVSQDKIEYTIKN
jgi:hypothetical protein